MLFDELHLPGFDIHGSRDGPAEVSHAIKVKPVPRARVLHAADAAIATLEHPMHQRIVAHPPAPGRRHERSGERAQRVSGHHVSLEKTRGFTGLAGFPTAITSLGRSENALARAPRTVRSAIVTPGPTNASAAIQQSSPIVIGSRIRGYSGLVWSCVPAQRCAYWLRKLR